MGRPWRRRRAARFLVGVLVVSLVAAAGARANPPNLVQQPLANFLNQDPPAGPEIVRTASGQDRLTFSSNVSNVQGLGSLEPGPLSLTGSRQDTTVNTMSAFQDVDGSESLAGAFQYNVAPSHQHWHFLNLDRYQLRAHDPGNAVRGVDEKTGFCIAASLNGNCDEDMPDALTLDETLAAGRSDLYTPERDGQYIDVTGLRPGLYELVEWANSDCSLRETTYDDNAQAMVIEIVAGDPPSVVSHPELAPYFDAWWSSHAHCLPHETVRPQISGAPVVGGQLVATPGSWLDRLATGFAYQWRLCDAGGAACADVPGATAPTYVPAPSDVGHTLRARVTATQGLDIEQLTAQDSDATTAVAVGPPPSGTPIPAPSASQSAPLAASATVRHRIRLRSLLRRGVAFKVRCSEACSVDARLMASERSKHRRRVVLVLAVADLRMSSAGSVTGHLKVSRKLRSRLLRGKLRQITLRVTVRDSRGQTRSILRRIRVVR